jgi:hypothetical protein
VLQAATKDRRPAHPLEGGLLLGSPEYGDSVELGRVKPEVISLGGGEGDIRGEWRRWRLRSISVAIDAEGDQPVSEVCYDTY